MKNMFSRQEIKEYVKHLLLTRAYIKRVHIVGCARSGTTMLHYAMSAFKNIILHDSETSPWSHPGLKDSFCFFQKYARKTPPVFFVTKRPAKWWYPDMVERLLDYVPTQRIFLINIVRDPRDVLTSSHPYDKRQFYVEPWVWEKSIAAGEHLMKNLAGYADKITLRYEDVILYPDKMERLLCDKLGLELQENISCWSQLENSVVPSDGPSRMLPYMHQLRNFDPASIGKWQHAQHKQDYVEFLLSASDASATLQSFMERYHYFTTNTTNA
jgi:hypothetical protein